MPSFNQNKNNFMFMIYDVAYHKWYNHLSKLGMLQAYIHWLVLHMRFKYSRLLISILFAHTIERHWSFVRSCLHSYWFSWIVGLVQLPSVLVSRISWTFWNRPMRFIFIDTSIWALLWMVRTGSHDFWCWVKFDKWIKSFDCSSSVQTV